MSKLPMTSGPQLGATNICCSSDGSQTGAPLLDRVMDDVGEGMSAASDSDTVEPRSVMMSPPNRRTANVLDEDPDDTDHNADAQVASNVRFTPRRGDLDDVPDDYEMNIEGFRSGKQPITLSDVDGEPTTSEIPSSLLRHLDKSYIKLEVISAKQIRCLIIFFNIFLLLAVAHTAILIALNNSVWRESNYYTPLPREILTDEQMKTGFGPLVVPRDSGSDPSQSFQSFGDLTATQSVSVSTTQRKPAPKSQCTLDFSSMTPIDAALASQLAAAGWYRTHAGGLVPGPVCPPSSPRQLEKQGDLPSGTTFTPPTPPAGLPIEGTPPPIPTNPTGTNPGSAGGSGNPQGQGSRPTPGTGAASARPETHVVLYFVPIVTTLIPPLVKIAHNFWSGILSVFFLVLGVLFLIRICRTKRSNLTHEQLWTMVLIFVAGLYFNVFENMIDAAQVIRTLDGIDENDQKFPGWVNVISTILQSIRDAAFLTFTYFYLWASFDSYRILDPGQRLTFRRFYLPKLAVLLPLITLQTTLYVWMRLELSEVPLLSGPAMAFIFSGYRMTAYLKWELVCAVLKTVLDGIVLLIIFRSGLKAMHALEQAPYMKYRAKRVGFRFFLYINFVFYVFFFVLYWIAFFGKPVGDLLLRLNMPIDRVRTGFTTYFGSGAWWLIVGYVTCTAFVHLPHTSVGWLRGWFVSSAIASPGSRWSFESKDRIDEEQSVDPSVDLSSRQTDKVDKSRCETWSNDEETPVSLVDNDSELQQQIVEPITYRKRESKNSLELKANCFTMQTHVIMFNFAWYVYYYGTPKLENFRPKENPLPFEFSVDQHIKSEATDTQALVLDCTDRIIVTFKGTTSMKNLRTSIRLSQAWLSSVIGENAAGEDESERLRRLFGARYTFGKIHKGFATAYMSVMTEVVQRVGALRAERMRPVFLTGHSLGGALATICSLDLWVKLNISRREIFVSTFGSPRVGNAYFAAVYKEVVPLHWRIVVDPDMIAKLPRVGYTHVGKKVVLTPHGDMIIDPNALENRPWTGEAAGFAYHRKASYLLAMRAWCVRYHGMTYTPVFWPFPVRPEDERRFAGAFDSSEDGEEDTGGWKVAQKIIRLDAMVDALGSVDDEQEENNNVAVVARWGRLTRRLLLNEKLGGAAGGGGGGGGGGS